MSKKVNKITEEELKSVKEANIKYQGLLSELGFRELQKTNLIKLAKQEADTLEELKKELEEKYGQVNINLEDGVYSEIEKEDAK
jgi:hypothetical protein